MKLLKRGIKNAREIRREEWNNYGRERGQSSRTFREDVRRCSKICSMGEVLRRRYERFPRGSAMEIRPY
ncbi:MAG: hypothetical protein ACTSUN_01600 [Promethearchaeota archaeon]